MESKLDHQEEGALALISARYVLSLLDANLGFVLIQVLAASVHCWPLSSLALFLLREDFGFFIEDASIEY